MYKFNICVFRVCTAVVLFLPVADEGGAKKNTGENAGASAWGFVRMKVLLATIENREEEFELERIRHLTRLLPQTVSFRGEEDFFK